MSGNKMFLKNLLLCAICLSCIVGLSGKPVTAKPVFVPLGADIDNYGYIITPSESLKFIYQRTRKTAIAAPELEYILSELNGKVVKQGKIARSGKHKRKLEYTIIPKCNMLKNGAYILKTKITGAPDWFPYAFDFYKPEAGKQTPVKRIVCLFDNLDPEGWGYFLTKGFNRNLELLKNFPRDKNIKVDLVLLCHNTPLKPGQRGRLLKWLNNGGKIIAWGLPGDTLKKIYPVKVAAVAKASDIDLSAKHVKILPNKADAEIFKLSALWKQDTYRYLKCAPKSNSVVLARFEDGSPAIIKMKVGKGEVFYFPGEYKSGSWFADLFLNLTGQASEMYSKSKTATLIVPRSFSDTSIGRHGYNTKISGLVFRKYGMMNHFGIWDTQLFAAGFKGKKPLELKERVYPVETNWSYRKLNMSGAKWGGEVNMLVSQTLPHLTMQPLSGQREFYLDFKKLRNYNYCAFKTKNGIAIIDLKKIGESNQCAKMSANWMLLWSDTDVATAPLLLILPKAPDKLSFVESRFNLYFSSAPQFISFVCPYGIKLLNHDRVEDWKRRLPKAVVDRIKPLSRMALAVPVENTERFRRLKDKIIITNHYKYLMMKDAWGTKALKFSAYPPVAALAAENSPAVKLLTPYVRLMPGINGPVCGASGKSSIEYELPMLDFKYPLQTSFSPPVVSDEYTNTMMQLTSDYLKFWLPKGTYIGFSVNKKNFSYFRYDVQPANKKLNETNLYNAKYLCLYRLVGMTCGMTQMYQFLTPEFNDVKRMIEKRLSSNDTTLSMFKYKSFIRYRNEPYTRKPYAIHFIYPVSYTRDGFRIFNDNNESFGVIAYALYIKALLGNNIEQVRETAEFIDFIASYPETFFDWATMCSFSKESSNGNGIDMLNSEYPGWLGYAKLNEFLGKKAKADFGYYAAAKTAVSAATRLFYAEYLRKNKSKISPSKWKNAKFCFGWGTGWAYAYGLDALKKANDSKKMWGGFKGLRKTLALGIDMWDSSKGTAPEMALMYKKIAPEAINEYEAFLWRQMKFFGVWQRVAYKSQLNADRAWIAKHIKQYSASKSTKPESLSFRAMYTPGYLAIILNAYYKTFKEKEECP
jgi:hypothetical protein